MTAAGGDAAVPSPPDRSLAGQRVVLTRAEHQAAEFAERLLLAGADVVHLPLLEIVPPADPRPLERAASELAMFDWVVLTSVNAVEALLDAAGGALPARLNVAAIGPATAAALRDHEITLTLLPATSHAEGLVEALRTRLRRGERVLLPQAGDARPVLAEGLRAAGAEVVRVVAYEKRIPAETRDRAAHLLSSPLIGWVVFTSPSTVRNFVEVVGGPAAWESRRAEVKAASIGPVTSAALREVGVEGAAVAEAEVASAEGVVAAMVRRERGGL